MTKVCFYVTKSELYMYLNLNGTEAFFDPNSRAAKIFQNRFGVPFLFYYEVLLPWANERYPTKPNCTGDLTNSILVEYKLISSLYILGRAGQLMMMMLLCWLGVHTKARYCVVVLLLQMVFMSGSIITIMYTDIYLI